FQGSIPQPFLSGCGIPIDMINYIQSLYQTPSYYTTFISYSSNDEEFAEHLFKDLKRAGIYCWYAPHSLRGGERFWERIIESIQTYDKVLVILSQSSLQSPHVQREVEEALKKEERANTSPLRTTTLLPLCIDNTIATTTTDWAATIRHS